MSTIRMFKVYMIMDKGGMTSVIVGAMGRAHATQIARQMYPNWHCTGRVEEIMS